MSAVVEQQACDCATLGADPQQLRQCRTCHKIYRGDKRLTSVSRVLSVWPQDPCSSCGWPIYSDHQPGCSVKLAIDNAKERGSAVDALVSGYVKGTLKCIPAGTRKDAVELFWKAKAWIDRHACLHREAQVLVGDDQIGGVLDLSLDGTVIDLKCSYNLEPTHPVQVGGYVTLRAAMGQVTPEAGILHVTERFKEAKYIPLKVSEITADFESLRQAWSVVERRKGNGKR